MTTAEKQIPIALTEQQLADDIGVSVSWLQHDRCTKRLLPFYRLGGRLIRYNRARVLEVLAGMEEGGVA